MRIPDGWSYVSDYCIKRDGYTICRIGWANGWTYEAWRNKEQIAVNLPDAQTAIEIVSHETNLVAA